MEAHLKCLWMQVHWYGLHQGAWEVEDSTLVDKTLKLYGIKGISHTQEQYIC